MDGKEIFKEILDSPQMKELLGVSPDAEILEDYESSSQHPEITVVQSIIEGQIRHTSDDALFKNIKKYLTCKYGNNHQFRCVRELL